MNNAGKIKFSTVLIVLAVLVVLGGISSLGKGDDDTKPTSTPNPTPTAGATNTPTPTESANIIDIIAGEKGEYGKDMVLNENTDFELHRIGYFVPAGKYKITNVGKNMTQVSIYKNETKTNSSGWDEWLTGEQKPLVLDVGATGEVEINDGFFIYIAEPDHITLEEIK